jgi:hypothetical protein
MKKIDLGMSWACPGRAVSGLDPAEIYNVESRLESVTSAKGWLLAGPRAGFSFAASEVKPDTATVKDDAGRNVHRRIDPLVRHSSGLAYAFLEDRVRNEESTAIVPLAVPRRDQQSRSHYPGFTIAKNISIVVTSATMTTKRRYRMWMSSFPEMSCRLNYSANSLSWKESDSHLMRLDQIDRFRSELS